MGFYKAIKRMVDDSLAGVIPAQIALGCIIAIAALGSHLLIINA